MVRRNLFLAALLVVTGIVVTAALAYEVKAVIVLERPDGNTELNSWVWPVKFPHGFHTMNVPCFGGV